MAILRTQEIREMKPEERTKRLKDLISELLRERAVVAAGARLKTQDVRMS